MENEATSATTRQYAPRQSANPYDAPYQSQLAQARFAPDNQFNDQTPDTSRLYHDPMAPNYPNYPANYQQAVAKKSGAVKWILITLICVALVSGGIAAMVISAIRAAHNSRVQAPVPEPLAEPGSIPPPPRPPPASGQFRLEQYKYPNATVNESVRAPGGNEVVKMTTGDSVSKVRDYYKKQLGNPSGEVNNGDGERVVFQISGPPMVIITIGEDEEDSDKTQIIVVRANMQLQKIFPK